MSCFREVWPGAEFGSSGMSVDEEMDGVRDILLNTAVGRLNILNFYCVNNCLSL